ncbi:MAG: hypothetical protein ACI4MQ_07410 [Candidatus Coproplasma sp.]
MNCLKTKPVSLQRYEQFKAQEYRPQGAYIDVRDQGGSSPQTTLYAI